MQPNEHCDLISFINQRGMFFAIRKPSCDSSEPVKITPAECFSPTTHVRDALLHCSTRKGSLQNARLSKRVDRSENTKRRRTMGARWMQYSVMYVWSQQHFQAQLVPEYKSRIFFSRAAPFHLGKCNGRCVCSYVYVCACKHVIIHCNKKKN